MNDSSRTKATPPHCLHIPEPTPKRTAPAQRGSASFAHKLKACRNPEKAWDLFIQEAPSELPFNSIPWPDAYGGVWSNILGVGGNASRKEVKEAHKKLQKRWHPDRFISRYQNRFSKADAERIVEKCNAITHKIIETKERFLKRK